MGHRACGIGLAHIRLPMLGMRRGKRFRCRISWCMCTGWRKYGIRSRLTIIMGLVLETRRSRGCLRGGSKMGPMTPMLLRRLIRIASLGSCLPSSMTILSPKIEYCSWLTRTPTPTRWPTPISPEFLNVTKFLQFQNNSWRRDNPAPSFSQPSNW